MISKKMIPFALTDVTIGTEGKPIVKVKVKDHAILIGQYSKKIFGTSLTFCNCNIVSNNFYL